MSKRVTIYVREEDRRFYDLAVKRAQSRGLSTLIRELVFAFLGRAPIPHRRKPRTRSRSSSGR